MKTVKKSVLIWYSAEEMFALVTDVAKYPEFLPWCDHAKVIAEKKDGMTAEIGIAFSGLTQSFTTRNKHVRPSQVRMELVAGPFAQLEGQWDFVAVGDGSVRACRVEFKMRYSFANAGLAKLVGPVFDKIADSLVDAFVKRAEQMYADA